MEEKVVQDCVKFLGFSASFLLRSTYRKQTWSSPRKIKPGVQMSILLKFWVLYFPSTYSRVAFSRWGRLEGHLCSLSCNFSLFSSLLMGPVVLVCTGRSCSVEVQCLEESSYEQHTWGRQNASVTPWHLIGSCSPSGSAETWGGPDATFAQW